MKFLRINWKPFFKRDREERIRGFACFIGGDVASFGMMFHFWSWTVTFGIEKKVEVV